MIAKLWRSLEGRRKLQEASILRYLTIHPDSTLFMIATGTQTSWTRIQVQLARMVNENKIVRTEVESHYDIVEKLSLGKYHDKYRISDVYQASKPQMITT